MNSSDREQRKLANAYENREAGFALVITVMLLAFLVLLLTSLATLTRVQTGTSSGTQRLAQARQNALVGLDIALGQLQATAGPDRRVTASAENLVAGCHYTGAWKSESPAIMPLTWLVSGNEGEDPRAFVPGSAGADFVTLIGTQTSGNDSNVAVPRKELRTASTPGKNTLSTTGHYAWWIGDQGVKAPVATPDHRTKLNYSPFDGLELRSRLQQQLGTGADAFTFDGRAAANGPLAQQILTVSQIAFFKTPTREPLGLRAVRQNFHRWSLNNFAVLADTARGGLRRDLSLRPELLGNAFAAWTDYRAYMEDPDSPVAPLPSPPYPASAAIESQRRRYRFTATREDAGIAHGVAPVLSHFLLTFNVRTDQSVGGSLRPIEVRARWMISLWNPYTSAFVPEDLQLEVEGLPAVQVINDTLGGVTVASVPLDNVYGSPLRLHLPWQPSGRADQQSWLPGRVYSWTSLENLNKAAATPGAGFESQFYVKNFNVSGQGVQRVASTATMSNSAQSHLTVNNPTRLTLRLFHAPTGARELLATYHAPEFAAFSTAPGAANAATYQFSYFFRIAESLDSVAAPELWLTTAGQDPRESVLPAGSYVPGANGNRPELYANFATSSFPDRLLDRSFPVSATSLTGQSYNEDTPLFELPREPLLSVGTLQQLHTAGTRPFAIGNSWGGATGWNAMFDRYFFSGISREVALPELTPGAVLPNFGLQVATRKADGTSLTRADLTDRSSDGFSSVHLLQGGAFNLNSTDAAAWLAVLRSGRHVSDEPFTAVNATATTGTSDDGNPLKLDLPGATFFRFAQSAQETAKADAGYAASTSAPPSGPNSASLANTHLFRKGVRALTDPQASSLAASIAEFVKNQLRASGPFRSVEEFLNSSPLFISNGGAEVSLLEKAIEAAALNRDVAEFSSQWLTQGDVMTLLAPVLFARSDTFLIRSYGDVVNPVTGAIEGRAWAEAMAQRQPAYVDPTQPAETALTELNSTNARFGRRFKIVFFRWLSAFDI